MGLDRAAGLVHKWNWVLAPAAYLGEEEGGVVGVVELLRSLWGSIGSQLPIEQSSSLYHPNRRTNAASVDRPDS